jgi:hypothetical protein
MFHLLARWGRLRSKLVDEQRVSNSCPPAFSPMPRARLRLFLALWLVLAVHSSPEGPQNRRYQQPARALANAGTFLVPPDASEAPDFLQTPVGKYAVVAPGLPLLLAPVHATLKAFLLPIHAGPEHPLWPKLFSIAACGLIIAPLLALAGVALFEILEQLEPRVSHRIGWALLAICGSPVLFYSSQGIWSHSVAAAGLLFVFWSLWLKQNPLLAGALVGVATAVDYATAIPSGTIILAWLAHERAKGLQDRFRDFFLLGLGVLIPCCGLLLYNHAITGSPWMTPQSLLAQQRIAAGLSPELQLFGLPTPHALWGLAASPGRGLAWYFPASLLLIPALGQMSWRKQSMGLGALLAAASIFLLNASYVAWHGDVSFGPRHLTPAIPFIVIAIAGSGKMVGAKLHLAQSLFGVSALVAFAGVATGPSRHIGQNLLLFFYRGPHLNSLRFFNQEFLPAFAGARVDLMTPFWIYAGAALAVWRLLKPMIRADDKPRQSV